MLSIGKLVAGAEDYYLNTVARGLEEYYTGSGEAPGTWLGDGAADLGLAGTVDAAELRNVLAGRHPGSGAALVAPRAEGRVAGFDLTYSAPKSVSLLYALAPEAAGAVRAAHDAATAAALTYLERHALFARRGHAGEHRISTAGTVAAAFFHRTSRAGDPQIHTHVLLANLVRGDDGRFGAPDARVLYFHARTAGFVYQAVLRAELARLLGIRFGPVVSGVAEIEGVDPALRDAFGTRRRQVVERLEALGVSSKRAGELAALDTRPAKQPLATADNATPSIHEVWRSRAVELGHDPDQVRAVIAQRRDVALEPERASAIADVLLEPDGLTAQVSAFERRDVVRAVAERLPDGGSLAEIERLADDVLQRDAVVRLETVGRGAEPRHTTAELLEIERGLLELSSEMPASRGIAGVTALERSLLARPSLAEEQVAMVRQLVTSGAGVEVVVGKAGTGKTYALDAARAAWESAGFRVIGTALAARAAAELQDGAGIASVTLATLRRDLERGATSLSARHVLVVDEAAMVGTRMLAAVVGAAADAGAKVVLVGDHRQLPEIETGGAFRALAERLDVVELSANRRQEAGWERAALEELRSGDVRVALDAYDGAGRLHVADTAGAARAALVGDWARAVPTAPHSRMYALRRSDVDELDALARAELRRRRRLGDDLVELPSGVGFALGDEVLCLRNDRHLGVTNGTSGRVLVAGPEGIEIATARGVRLLDAAYLEAGHLAHGYASTVHKAQGATVERAFVLGSLASYREAGYVAMSRARAGTDLYVVGGSFENGIDGERSSPIDAFAQALSVSRAKGFASLEAAHSPIGRVMTARQSASDSERPVLETRRPMLVELLGAPPPFADERLEWRRVARLVERYRAGGIEGHGPLGKRPRDAERRSDYDEALEAVVTWRRRLERTLELHGPGLGLGR